MNESGFIGSIHKKLDKNQVIIWKIFDQFNRGVPDAWYLGPAGIPLFIEYKWLKQLPKKSNTVLRPNLSRSQIEWLDKLSRFGHKCLVVVGSPFGVIIYREYQWETGVTVGELEIISKANFISRLEKELYREATTLL